mgnify:FL=1
MSDTETIVEDVTTDVDTEIDTTDDSDVELTVEDYNKEKARREKAEKALVDLKRKAKELEGKSSEPTEKYLTVDELDRRDFLKANPELADYTKELWDYQKKGLSLDEAKTLILNSDKARVNREKVNSLGLSDWETSSKKSSYNIKELDKLASSNPSEYARVRNEMDAGKIKLDR